MRMMMISLQLSLFYFNTLPNTLPKCIGFLALPSNTNTIKTHVFDSEMGSTVPFLADK